VVLKKKKKKIKKSGALRFEFAETCGISTLRKKTKDAEKF